MIDPLSLAVGAGLLSAGFLAGRIGRRRRSHAIKPSEPVCGCVHHYAMHDPTSGRCHGVVKLPYNQERKCTCRVYTGPEPLPSMWSGGVALVAPATSDPDKLES